MILRSYIHNIASFPLGTYGPYSKLIMTLRCIFYLFIYIGWKKAMLLLIFTNKLNLSETFSYIIDKDLIRGFLLSPARFLDLVPEYTFLENPSFYGAKIEYAFSLLTCWSLSKSFFFQRGGLSDLERIPFSEVHSPFQPF